MSLLTIESISKQFGATPLFEGLSLTISEGDHVGLIGPNGSGKSTLLSILAGVEEPDSGRRAARRDVTIGYVEQEPPLDEDGTALEIVMARIRNGGHPPADDHEVEVMASAALSRAGFDDFSVRPGRLSGGWRRRLAFAAVLASKPDVLLLDEPTNHLDIEGIEWLEKTLAAAPLAFVVISHDRRFLENVANRIVEIHRAWPGGMIEVRGSYSRFLEERDAKLANLASYRDSLANTVRREIEWLRRGAKARTRKAQARIDEAGRRIEKLEDTKARLRAVDQRASIDFAASDRKSRRLLEAKEISCSMGGRRLFSDLDVLLRAGTRIGILGANGSGKTTLLRLLAGEIEPDDGEMFRADGLRVVRFEQDRASLDPNVTLSRALAPEGDSVMVGERPVHVASWAKRFLFQPEQLVTRVGTLSGGEQARVLIARMMLQPADVLILDEPTNDLDIPTLEVLEENLSSFEGALVLVTHDRFLLDRMTDALLALDGEGGAEWFADLAQWEAERRSRRKSPEAIETADARTSKATKRKLSWSEQKEWSGMEERLLGAESELEKARSASNDPTIAADAGELHKRFSRVQELEREVERLYARWAELEEKRDGSSAAD